MLVHPNFDPVALSFGPIAIHWYGLMYLLGFTLGVWLGRIRARQTNSGWQPEEVMDLLFYIALGVIIGGRLGYVLFYHPLHYLAHPLQAIALWDGGMSFHGGLIGVGVAIWLYARKTRRPFLAVGDFLAPLVAPGLGFGRLGNFINQELWGRATTADAPWAMWFPAMPDAPRHPSQLYEAALEGVLLFLIVWLYSAKPRAHGKVCAVFLLGYGAFRFLVEFAREPDAHLGTLTFGLSMGQLLCLPMLALGLYLLLLHTRTTPKPHK